MTLHSQWSTQYQAAKAFDAYEAASKTVARVFDFFNTVWGIQRQSQDSVRTSLERGDFRRDDSMNRILLEKIQDRFRKPFSQTIRKAKVNNGTNYLNSNEALADLDTLIFEIHRNRFFPKNTPDFIVAKERHNLLKLAVFLRKLSNESGLIDSRSSKQTAFTHWMEATKNYIELDPNPTIEGIKRLATHDSREDPKYNKADRRKSTVWRDIWNERRTRQRLEHFAGQETVEYVEQNLTKPLVKYHGSHLAGNRYKQAKLNSAQEFLQKILASADHTFLEKTADILANLRNLDGFILIYTRDSQEWINGREKIARKCRDALLFLDRLEKLSPAYFVALVFEIQSLNNRYNLQLSLPVELIRQRYAVAMRKTQKDFACKRMLSRDIHETIKTHRPTLDIYRKAA